MSVLVPLVGRVRPLDRRRHLPAVGDSPTSRPERPVDTERTAVG